MIFILGYRKGFFTCAIFINKYHTIKEVKMFGWLKKLFGIADVNKDGKVDAADAKAAVVKVEEAVKVEVAAVEAKVEEAVKAEVTKIEEAVKAEVAVVETKVEEAVKAEVTKVATKTKAAVAKEKKVVKEKAVKAVAAVKKGGRPKKTV
jgi:hypothetical protein